MKHITRLSIFFFAVLLFGACEPQELGKPDIGDAPDAAQLSFTITPIDDFHFTLENTSSVTGITSWTFGNGVSAIGDKVEAYYALKETYTIVMTLATKGGQTSISREFTQDKIDYSVFDDPIYVNLTGGIEAADGKTWVVDSLYKGHFGIGPADGTTPEWWSADPKSKSNTGSYDDEFVLNINGFTMEFKNNGNSYVKDYRKGDVNYTVLSYPFGEPDALVGFTPADISWTLIERDGATILKLISEKPAFFGFDYGAQNNEYRIDEITENTINLSCIGGDGNRWYYILIKKGYERPSVPDPEPDPKELEEHDMFDDFEGAGNIVWNTTAIDGFDVIDNFAPVGVNTSASIVRYTKGAGEWSNVAIQLDYLLDLSTRNKFTMKVFMPTFNDYVTVCDPGTSWLATHNLIPQIDVKLQDSSLGGNAWQTQQVRTHVLETSQLGQWVELTFDFSDVSTRTDFDQIIIQFGMEGHCNTGIFYFDDFKLLP